MNVTRKVQVIKAKEASLPPERYLIFQPPDEETLYTEEEMLQLVRTMMSEKIPTGLSIVQKSHWIKMKVIELLGYRRPVGLRTRQARAAKPKFQHQLLDIFAQSSRNLQVWNYVPYANLVIPALWNEEGPRYKFSDCRYLIIHHDLRGNILKILLKKGSELAAWDLTGTRTIKWQAIALGSFRERAMNAVLCDSNDPLLSKMGVPQKTLKEKQNEIGLLDVEQIPLITSHPDPELLFTLNELSTCLRGFLGRKFQNLGTGQERVIGQTLEKQVVKALGYRQIERTETGEYPDLLHQVAEVKFQYSGTIDLGKNLPSDPQPIGAEWNRYGISNRDVRYTVFLMGLTDKDQYVVESIVLTSGANFNNYFSICEGTNFKVQLTIPADELA